MIDLIFWGGTGQAKVLNEAIQKDAYRLVAIVDNNKLIPPPFNGVATLHGNAELDKWLSENYPKKKLPDFAVAIGGSRGKDRLEIANELIARGLSPLNIIHSKAFVASDVVLGKSVQILAMSAICAHVKIGDAVIVNTSASVDHECIIEDGVHIGPGATLAGEVYVSRYAFIGAGAVILPKIKIGEAAIVGAGAIVTKNVAAYATVIGCPARPM